jgi:uncharacterized protein YabE (DUF348 family)
MKTSLLGVLIIVTAIGVISLFELRQTTKIIADGEEQTATTWAWSVGDVLSAVGITVKEGDTISPPLNARAPHNGQIFIERASWITISTDGNQKKIWTPERKVNKLLEEADIDLNPDDQVYWNGIPISADLILPKSQNHSLEIHRTKTVVVTDANQTQKIISSRTSLGDVLWEGGVILNARDQLDPQFESLIEQPYTSAEIQRSREISIIDSNGKTQSIVQANTVGEALAQAGMALQGLDYSIPAEDTTIPISDTIRLVRVREEVFLESEPLPFGFLTQPLEDVDLDNQQVIQVGEYGLKAKRVRVTYEDGIEVKRQTEDEWVAREPKPRIVGYGTKINIRTAQTPDGPIEYWRAVEVYGSTYSPCRSGVDKCYPNTSSGKPVEKGVIAVTLDWYRYMKGLPAYVPNYGFGTIEDVGGGLPDRHWIDLGYSDEDWVGWGGWMTIYFLTPVPSNIMWILE